MHGTVKNTYSPVQYLKIELKRFLRIWLPPRVKDNWLILTPYLRRLSDVCQPTYTGKPFLVTHREQNLLKEGVGVKGEVIFI